MFDFPDRDIYEMDIPELKEYLEWLREVLYELDEEEPSDMNSEEYDAWGDRHEELEDCIDEVIERLEELEG